MHQRLAERIHRWRLPQVCVKIENPSVSFDPSVLERPPRATLQKSGRFDGGDRVNPEGSCLGIEPMHRQTHDPISEAAVPPAACAARHFCTWTHMPRRPELNMLNVERALQQQQT